MDQRRLTDRAFGYAFTGLFTFITIIAWWVFDVVAVGAMVSALIFACLATAAPGVLMPLNRLWAKVVPKIALVTNTLVTGAAFCVVIVPIGIFMRVIKRDPLHRAVEAGAESYWQPVTRDGDKDTYQDIF